MWKEENMAVGLKGGDKPYLRCPNYRRNPRYRDPTDRGKTDNETEPDRSRDLPASIESSGVGGGGQSKSNSRRCQN